MLFYMDISISQHTQHPAWYHSNFLRVAHMQFQDFKKTYRKFYGKFENYKRFKLFQSNLVKINYHNSNPNRTWTMGVNQFSDLTDEEFEQTYTCNIDTFDSTIGEQTRKRISESFIKKIPNRVDWRQSGVVTKVKDQGTCGSCWAFRATEQLESYAALANVSNAELSVQELVSCVPNIRNISSGGCRGGNVWLAYNYVKLFGISSSEQYPYTSSLVNPERDMVICNHNIKKPAIGIQDFGELESNDLNAVLNHVANVGPLGVQMGGAKFLHNYKSGVLKCNFDEPIKFSHAVQIVGYGTDSKYGDYWLIRNSWGKNWGEEGYFRLSRTPTLVKVKLDE